MTFESPVCQRHVVVCYELCVRSCDSIDTQSSLCCHMIYLWNHIFLKTDPHQANHINPSNVNWYITRYDVFDEDYDSANANDYVICETQCCKRLLPCISSFHWLVIIGSVSFFLPVVEHIVYCISSTDPHILSSLHVHFVRSKWSLYVMDISYFDLFIYLLTQVTWRGQ
jgi:hypothetical protein